MREQGCRCHGLMTPAAETSHSTATSTSPQYTAIMRHLWRWGNRGKFLFTDHWNAELWTWWYCLGVEKWSWWAAHLQTGLSKDWFTPGRREAGMQAGKGRAVPLHPSSGPDIIYDLSIHAKFCSFWICLMCYIMSEVISIMYTDVKI